MRDQIELRATWFAQAEGAPAQPDNIIGALRLLHARNEAAQGFRRRITAIGDAYFAFDAGAAVKRLAAMFVGQFQMAEAAGAKVIDAMHAPIRAATARLADAASIRDPQAASRPARTRRRRPGRQQFRDDRREEVAGLMQAVVERGVGQIGHAAQMRPGGGLPQRHAAGTARQRKAQKRLRIRNAATTHKRPRLLGQCVEVQITRDTRDQSRPVVGNKRCRIKHLS